MHLGEFNVQFPRFSRARRRPWSLPIPSGVRCRARTQKFAFSKISNFRCHTRFFIYQSIFLKFLAYLRNTLNRQWCDFQHDRTFTFWVIKDFLFSRISNFTREYLTKVAKSQTRVTTSLCLLAVKIASKSAQPFGRYGANKKCNARTYVRTYARTYVRYWHTANS